MPSEGDISFLEFALILARYKTVLLGVPFTAAVLVSAYMLMQPNIYTGMAKIVPPLQNQSIASMALSQLSSLTGMGGATKASNDIYVSMLKSRTVADNLIQRFNLMMDKNNKKKEFMSDARKDLASVTNITNGKDGVITIEVDDENPKRAADIANAYVDELLNLTRSLAITEASQRRLFLEKQFLQAKDNLAKAEALAREGLERGGLVMVDEQGRSMVATTANLRAQITAREVQLGAFRTFATDKNPDLVLIQQQILALKRELAKIEGTSGAKRESVAGKGGAENLRLLRDVKYNEALFEQLAKQFELAKIREAEESSVVQVMDNAVAPDRKSKPKRSLTVIVSALVVGFLTLIGVFIKEAIARSRHNPDQARQLQDIRANLGLNPSPN